MPQRELEINQAFGEWLERLANWDVFATWTFGRPPVAMSITAAGKSYRVDGQYTGHVTEAGAAYWAKKIFDIWRVMASLPIYGFWVTEVGEVGGLVHLHALVGNVAHVSPYCGKRLPVGLWNKRCCLLHSSPVGCARVLPYDKSRGAGFYVAKYVTKQVGEYGFVGFDSLEFGSSLKRFSR